MPQSLSLKDLERKAWSSTFQDGLWDLYLGLLPLGMAIGALLQSLGLPNSPWFLAAYLVWAILCIYLLRAGKKLLTIPRMGRVKFGAKGKARARKTRLLLVASVLFGLLVALLAAVTLKGQFRWPADRQTWAILLGAAYVLNVLIVFSLMAVFLDYPRLCLIGILYAMPVPLDLLARQMTGIKLGFASIATPALVIIVTGSISLGCFLHDYPAIEVPAQGAPLQGEKR